MSIAAGLLLMLLATSMWGGSFVAPLILRGFTPIEITLGRYFFYGAVSVVLWLTWYRRQHLSPRAWRLAFLYAVAGHIGFSGLVTFGIQQAGAEVCVPLIGVLPVCVSVFGNARLSELRWGSLAPPLAVVSIGLLGVLVIESGLWRHEVRLSLVGIASIVLTIVMWTWYAVHNAVFLRKHPEISGGAWACAVGIATFGIALAGTAMRLVGVPDSVSASTLGRDAGVFLAVTLFLGCGSSWMASVLFNRASTRLPMSLVGELIVLETIFGLAYVYVYQWALPPWPELIGVSLVFWGIVWSIRVLEPQPRLAERPRPPARRLDDRRPYRSQPAGRPEK
jgi:drug/metabolite transporter (DMT)-like permease